MVPPDSTSLRVTPSSLRHQLPVYALAFALLSFSSPTAAEGANSYGGWVPAPDVVVPGTPKAELTIGGTPYLLLETPDPAVPFGALLWNPTDTISLAPGSNVVVNFVAGHAGMQTASGPLVFAYGDFEVSGTPTRMMMWDGASWGLPLGPISGVAPRVLGVRNTPSGPELWAAGDVMVVPGSTGFSPIARFDGTQWSIPGSVLGQISELEIVDEGSATGDVIYVAGNLISAGGLPAENVARYDGSWSNLAGGVSGSDPLLSVIELTPGQPEIWVTINSSTITPLVELHRWHQGSWEELTPPLSSGFATQLGRMALLPTYFGDWVIGEAVISLHGETAAPGFDPVSGEWYPVPTSSRFSFSFDSPAGLFPAGIYDSSSALEPRRWKVSAAEFIRGDANSDAQIDISDAILVLGTIFPDLMNPLPPITCLEAANAHRNSVLNISDAILILGAIFPDAGVPKIILPPFPDCGVGLSFGSLGCDEGPMNCP